MTFRFVRDESAGKEIHQIVRKRMEALTVP